VSIAERWVISSPVAATQLSMNAGDRSQPQIAFMKAVERATANKSLHTPDLGGKATTKQVTDAVCETLRSAND
jgi:isocitrate/isopropylmalate dehydrogenase